MENNRVEGLLLKDLCSRLPYGVHVLVHDTFEYSTVPFEKVYLKSSDISSLIDSISLNERYNSKDKRFNRIVKERKDFLEFKPYLFPLSSMTDKQKEEHKDLLDNQYSLMLMVTYSHCRTFIVNTILITEDL